MKKHIIVIMSLLVCVLAGCQNTPQEVIQKSEGYQNNAEIKTDDMEFDTLENAKEQSVEDLKIQTQNLILPEKISWGTMDNIYLLTMKYKENFLEKREEIAKLFGIKVKKWNEETDPIDEPSAVEERGHYIGLEDNGFTSIVNKEMQSAGNNNERITIKGIDRMQGEKTDIQIDLNGDKVNLEDEIEYVESWLKKNWIYSPAIEYRVGKVLFCKLGKTDLLEFNLFGYYKGMQITGGEFGTEFTKTNANGAKLFKTTSIDGFFFTMHPHQWSGFSTGTQSYDLVQEKKEDKVLTVKSAIAQVQKKLSGFNKKKIEQIRVNYKMNLEYSDEEYQLSTEQKLAHFNKAGRKIIMTPVYSFLMSKGCSGQEADYDECTMYSYVDVNMLTGEVTTDLDEEF